MFYGVLNNSSGVTVEELLRYLENVIAHGDGGNIVYSSSMPCVYKPVTMISCEPDCVLMEVRDSE